MGDMVRQLAEANMSRAARAARQERQRAAEVGRWRGCWKFRAHVLEDAARRSGSHAPKSILARLLALAQNSMQAKVSRLVADEAAEL